MSTLLDVVGILLLTLAVYLLAGPAYAVAVLGAFCLLVSARLSRRPSLPRAPREPRRRLRAVRERSA